MTKLRAPLTAQLALTRIAGVLSWERCGEVTGRSARTVLDWSDPDTSAGISLDAATLLDLEYHAAGGEGFPLFEWYTLKLQVERAGAEACRQQLLQAIGRAAKETGEATAAGLAAASAGASQADLILAERETEESIAALTRTLSQLRALRPGGEASLPGGNPS